MPYLRARDMYGSMVEHLHLLCLKPWIQSLELERKILHTYLHETVHETILWGKINLLFLFWTIVLEFFILLVLLFQCLHFSDNHAHDYFLFPFWPPPGLGGQTAGKNKMLHADTTLEHAAPGSCPALGRRCWALGWLCWLCNCAVNALRFFIFCGIIMMGWHTRKSLR